GGIGVRQPELLRQLDPVPGRNRAHRYQVVEQLEMQDPAQLLALDPGRARRGPSLLLPVRDRPGALEAILQPFEHRCIARFGAGMGEDELPDPRGHLQFPAYFALHTTPPTEVAGRFRVAADAA